MIDERHVVTTEVVLRRGQLFRSIWIGGWLFGAICLGISGYTLGLDRGRKESLHDIQVTTEKLRESTALQEKSVKAFIKAWEDQREAFDLVKDWAYYVHDRASLADMNDGVIIKRPRKLVKK